MYIYEVRPRQDKRGVDLISDALPCGRLWYGEPDAIDNVISYTKHRTCSHHKVIRVYDAAGNVTETHEQDSTKLSSRATTLRFAHSPYRLS